MLIPWGHDSSQLRRRPWVTYAMAALCLLAYIGSMGLQDPSWEQADTKLEEAFNYWEMHPYLDGNERLVRSYWQLGEDDYAWWEEETGGGVPDPLIVAEEQARLEAMTAEARELLDGHPWYRFGLVPAKPTAAGLFGHMFLHSGLLHLLGNLWFLILSGPYIEDRWGRGLFAAFYLASGVAGAALFVATQPGFDFPLVGASGAVSGILGAFLVCCRQVRIKFFYWVIWPGTFAAPAWAMLPLWFASELMSAFSAGDASPVAYFAHVGGFAFGVAAALAIRWAGLESKLSNDLGELDGETGSAVLDATRRAIQDGRMDEAIAQAGEALADGQAEPAAVKAYLEAVHGADRERDVAPTLTRHLWSAIEWRKKEAAIALWAALAAQDMAPSGRGEPLLQLAGWLRGAGRGSEANLAIQGALPGADGALAVRIARAARKHDPVLVKRAAERALASPDTADADRKAMQALMKEAVREARRRGWILLDEGERVERGRGRDVRPSRSAGEAIALDDSPIGDYEHEILDGGQGARLAQVVESDARETFGAELAGPGDEDATVALDLGATSAPAGRSPGPLEAGEAIDISDILGDDDEPPLSLPDPETAGGEAFLDSLHTALASEGISESDLLEKSGGELTDEPKALDFGAGGNELFDRGALELGESADPMAETAAPGLVPSAPIPAQAPQPAALVQSPEPGIGFGEDDLLALDEDDEKAEEPPPRRLQVMSAVPLGIDETHLTLDVEGRGRTRLALERIDAVGTAGVNGLSDAGKPVLVIDLCLNWTGHDDLQVVRLRSDTFDPRKLVDAEGSRLKALRAFSALLATRSRAVELPAAAAPDAPFKIFASAVAYQLEVLRAIR